MQLELPQGWCVYLFWLLQELLALISFCTLETDNVDLFCKILDLPIKRWAQVPPWLLQDVVGFWVDRWWFHSAEIQESQRHLGGELITSFDLCSNNHQTHWLPGDSYIKFIICKETKKSLVLVIFNLPWFLPEIILILLDHVAKDHSNNSINRKILTS